jgi:hypothetical protein
LLGNTVGLSEELIDGDILGTSEGLDGHVTFAN